jgi:hypothetical protein
VAAIARGVVRRASELAIACMALRERRSSRTPLPSPMQSRASRPSGDKSRRAPERGSAAGSRLKRARRSRGRFARRPVGRVVPGSLSGAGRRAYFRIARIRQSGPAPSLVVASARWASGEEDYSASAERSRAPGPFKSGRDRPGVLAVPHQVGFLGAAVCSGPTADVASFSSMWSTAIVEMTEQDSNLEGTFAAGRGAHTCGVPALRGAMPSSLRD